MTFQIAARACLGIFGRTFTFLVCLAANAQSPPLEVYGKMPAVERVALSSSGNHIALLGQLKSTRGIAIIGSDNKLQRTFITGDMKVDSIAWVGDELLLMEHRNTAPLGLGFTADKAELTSMTVLSMGDGSHWEVFQKERLITGGIRGFYGVVERTGHWYGYFGGITLDQPSIAGEAPDTLNHIQPVLYEVDLLSAKTRAIAKRSEDQSVRRDWIIGPDGAVAATFDLNERRGEWTLRNAARAVIATGRNPKGDVGLVGLGRSTDKIFYRQQDETTDLIHFYEIPQGGGTPVELLPDIAIRELLRDSGSRELLGYVTDEDYPQTRFFDERMNAVIRAVNKAFPDRHVQLEDSSGDFRRHIVKTDGPGDPGTWWFVDTTAGTAIPLGIYYQVPPSQVGPVSVVKYHAVDGMELAGILTLPPGKAATDLPVIMLPHGGPADRNYPRFDWWAQAFAVQGYAVFQPNFRGSTGYGAAFEQAGRGEWGRKMQTDISDGLAELARQGIVDPKRACIMGGSYGGYAALAGVTLQQGLYRCAVSVAGIGDIGDLYNTDLKESGHSGVMFNALNGVLGKYQNFDNISPIKFAIHADAPVLLIHGKDDTVVNYSQSRDMEQALRSAGKVVELVTLNGEDHWLSRSATRLEMLQRASEFIRKYNPP
jgi:dipeptidyl aminopeptidase/acylaminoacyl peptidase